MNYSPKDLMKGTVMTGNLSEVHVKNLKMYPFIFLDEIKEASISYDIVTDPSAALPGAKSRIEFTLSFAEGFPKDDMRNGIENLEKAIEILMAHKVTVIVKDKNGKVFGKQDK